MEVTILYYLYLLLCSLAMKNYICTMTRMNHTAGYHFSTRTIQQTEDHIQLNTCEKIRSVFTIMFSYSVFKVGWNGPVYTAFSITEFSVTICKVLWCIHTFERGHVLISGFKLPILLKALPVTNLSPSVFCYSRISPYVWNKDISKINTSNRNPKIPSF